MPSDAATEHRFFSSPEHRERVSLDIEMGRASRDAHQGGKGVASVV
jgi:hypothetical protein